MKTLHVSLVFKKILFFYLIISDVFINSAMTIYPDHYETLDEIFTTSQVNGVTNKRFYYDIGYFTNRDVDYYSSKYGITYSPIKCTNYQGNDLTYSAIDRTSFFAGTQKPIRDTGKTRSQTNKVEETKLYQNTMKGKYIQCPCPWKLFHQKTFVMTYKLPMISSFTTTLSVRLFNVNPSINEEICSMSLTANKFEVMTIVIYTNTDGIYGSSIEMEYVCNGIHKKITAADPVDFKLRFDSTSEIILSNYVVTIEDQDVLEGTKETSAMQRGKTGLDNSCNTDNDCFYGYMCNIQSQCLRCHQSCLRCTVDISESNSMNYCTMCNLLSITSEPDRGICDIGYVDVSQFENFDVSVKPDGNDFNDRQTLAFWVFFADTFNSPTNSGSIYHIVLKDRLVVSLIPGNKIVRVYCHAYEDIFRHATSDVTLSNDYEKQAVDGYYVFEDVPSYNQKQYMQGDSVYSIDGHWFHVSCASSFDHELFYVKTVLNGESEIRENTLKHETLYSGVENDIYFHHIINDGYLTLSFKNFKASKTKIYLRYFMLFKEYMPTHMNYMYFDFVGLADFYEILYQIPFNKLYYGTNFKIKGYKYKGEEEDIKLTYSPDKVEDYSPALNFKHLNLPKPNTAYKEIDVVKTEVVSLQKQTGQKFVYDDNLPLCCNEYLDYTQNICTDTCTRYEKLPYEGVSDVSGYCDYDCSSSMNCDHDHLDYENLDYNGKFCTNYGDFANLYNLFFKCEDSQKDYYLQYSGFYSPAELNLQIPTLKSYIIEFWYYPDFFLNAINEKLFQYPTDSKNYFFHSNAYDGYFLGTQTQPPVIYDAGNTNDVNIEGYQAKEWNKFMFYTKYDKDNNYYTKIIYTNHNLNNPQELTRVVYPELGSLTSITFCEKTCQDNKQNAIHWTTGYYKNLRIWNGDIASPYEVEQYDTFYPSYTNRISSILYYFPFRNEFISNNKIIDPKTKTQFEITKGNYNLRKYNYSSKFDRTMALGFYGKYIDPVTGEEKNCAEGCARCWETGYCFECKDGYYLFERKCILTTTYYFKSPNIVESTLDVEITRIKELEGVNSVTMTFWLKALGFSADDGVLIFAIGEKLYMYFSGDVTEATYPYGLSFYNGRYLLVNDQNYRDKIGKWTFFSIAYHKQILQNVTPFFPAMMKFEINNESFEVNLDNLENDLEFSKFIMKRYLFGLFRELKFYSEYIIGTIPYEKNKYTLTTPFYIPTPIVSYFPPSPTDKGCFETSYVKDSTLNDFECVGDSSDSYDTPSCSFSEENKGSAGRCFNMCMGESTEGTNWGYCSCTAYNYNSQMIIKNNNKNTCRPFDYINFAKSSKIKIEGVSTAKITKKYTMQFWMYAYNYYAGRFGGITFFWNGHNKLVVSKGKQASASNVYEFTCIPYVTETSEATISQTTTITIQKWNYLSCAVDFTTTSFYINVNTINDELYLKRANLDTDQPTSVLQNQQTTYLTISDDSIYDDWGYLFFRQIRLWSESYFNAEFLSRIKINTKSLFPYLLQQWEPVFVGYRGNKFFNNFNVYELDYNGQSFLSFSVSYTGVYGMNVIDEDYYNDVDLCSENGEYYDVTLGSCLQFTDLSKMKDFQFNSLPVAYSGSYSIGFWLFTEDASTLSSGLHIMWSLHMQITIIRRNRLEGFCFPQAYYTDSVTNDDIVSKLANALNSATVYLVDENTSESGTWIWVICAMSHYNGKFYINGNDESVLVENTLNKEVLYQDSTGTTYTSYPMRYFMSSTSGLLISTLKIINITNTKKIYFRQITLFRDYIPYWYSKSLRYMNLARLESNKMQSVLFFVNFAQFELSAKKLTYYYQYRRKGDSSYVKYELYTTLSPAASSSTFELSANFVFLPLCEFSSTVKMKYDSSQNLCVAIDDCDLTKMYAYYCMEENTPLACETGQYIDYDGTSDISCHTGCTDGSTIRQPGCGINPGICNSACPENTQNCPSKQLNNFVSGFTCLANNYRIGYRCPEISTNADSGLFFSKCYNSPNFYRIVSTDTQSKLSYGYFYEFWFKLDNMLSTCKDYATQTKEYYLYSTPHSIYLDTSSNIFYYEISVATSLNARISGISTYEWNKVIIKTTLDTTLGQNVYIYVNFDLENPVATFNSISSSNNMQLQYISFCSRGGSGDCTPGSSSINWGSAYYRNIRLWDLKTSSLEMIEDFNGQLFTEYPQSLILYYPLTIRYMDVNKIQEIISGTDTISVTHQETNNFQSTDNNVFYNYELYFDWGANNLNYYISSMDTSTGTSRGLIDSSACHSYCKRCFSSVSNDCYECNVGYVLVNKECKKTNGYYLKTPAITANTIIPFSLKVGTVSVANFKAWTFCIYMKFEGVALSGLNYAKIISFKESSYIAFDTSTTNLVFVVESKDAFRDTNFNNYYGIWIPLCVANYLSGSIDTLIYPNMLTFQVNKIDIPYYNNYKLPDKGFVIDQISLNYEVIAFFADFRIYNKFLHNNFGTIISATAESKNLFIHYDLNSGQTSCIQQEYLSVSNAISVNCIEDYNIYLDSSKACNGEDYYFDTSLKALTKPCAACDSGCVTLCFNPGVQECTCDMTDALYWLRRHTTKYRTYCQYLPFIDFSVLNDITINVPSSNTYESTLEVWVFIYSYNENQMNFKEMSIIWNKHNKITIYNSNNSLFAKCYALWDESNTGRYTEYISQSVTPYAWNNLRCGSEFISHKHKYFFGSNQQDLLTTDYPNERMGQVTTLTITTDESSYDSYGFVFLREMKLWQQYNYLYIDTSRINLKTYGKYVEANLKTTGIFPGLLAFFKNEFNIDDYEEVKDRHQYKILNLLGDDTDETLHFLQTYKTSRRSGFIGYNVVDPSNSGIYSELILCDEGMVYSESTKSCSTPAQTKCSLPADTLDNCITCNEDEVYVNPVDGTCVSECPTGYYARDDINACRICDITCYECTGPLYNECTACTDTLNLVPDLHICILHCQDYGLTKSPVRNNLCVIFDADAELVNVKEEIPINIYDFDYLQANVTKYTSKNYVTKWVFDAEATKVANNVTDMTFPSTTPFNGDITNLKTSIDNTFFELGKKYVVNLEITSENERDPSKTVTVVVPFTLTMNSYPVNGTLYVMPEIGLYNTTTFVISSLDWVDDTTDTLEYKFYSKETGIATIKNLSDWSKQNEVSSNFTVLFYQQPSTTITIYCEIRDNYNASITVNKTITLANQLANGVYTIEKAMSQYYLPTAPTDLEYYHRSEFLMTLGINDYKSVQPARLQTRFSPSLDGTSIIMTDPACTTDFCNSRGNCEIMDVFLVCYCFPGYTGRNCQLDQAGYDKLEAAYKELNKRLMTDIQNQINYYQLKTFHNLYFGAAQFIQDTTFFSTDLETLLEFVISTSEESFKNNTAEYFDLLDDYFSYSVMRLEQTRAKTKNSTGLPYRNITLDNNTMYEFKESFSYINEKLLKLLNKFALIYKDSPRAFEYEKSNFYASVTPVTPSFNETNFWVNRTKNYRSYVDFMKCLNYIEVQKLTNPYYQRFLIFIEYYFFPFGYNNTLLLDNTSPTVTMKIADVSNGILGKYVSLTDCIDTNYLVFHLPYSSYSYIDKFNYQKNLYDPNQYLAPDDDIFKDPIFIDENGVVTDDTVEKRIEKYNRIYNISPKYYDEILEGFSTEGVTYINFTNDTNYVVFNSSHLTEFTAFFIKNNASFVINNRFYYLYRTRLFKHWPNFISAIGSSMFLALFILYAFLVIIFACYDRKYTDQENVLDFIKKEIVKINLRYKQDLDALANDIVPNEFKNPYSLNNIKSKGQIKGPVGFGGALTTGSDFWGDNADKRLYTANFKGYKKKKKSKNIKNDDIDIQDVDEEDQKNNEDGKEDKYTIYGFREKKKTSNNAFFNKNDYFEKYRKKGKKGKDKTSSKNVKTDANNIPKEFENKEQLRQQQLQEFADLTLTTSEFIMTNFKTRTVFINSIFKISLFHPRWKKLTCLLTEIALLMLLISIFLTQKANITLKNIPLMILFSLITIICTDVLMYLLAFLFRFPEEKERRLLLLVKSSGDLVIIKEWDHISYIQGFKALIGYIICFAIWVISFYVNFGFTVVWKVQNGAFIFCFCFCIVFDLLIFELVIEAIIGIFYDKRRGHGTMRVIGEFMNRARNYRCLSP